MERGIEKITKKGNRKWKEEKGRNRKEMKK